MATRYGYRNGILTFFDPAQKHERVSPLAPIVFHEDFFGITVVDGTTIWTAKDVHAEATEANVANQHGGVFGMGIGVTDGKQEAGLTMGDQLNFNLDKGPIIEFVAALHTLPTLLSEIYFGVGGAYVQGTLAAADQGPLVHAVFMADGSGAITIHTDDGATDKNAIATGVTLLADAYHTFRIDFTNVADVLFFIDGERVARTTTFDMSNGANVGVQPYMMVYKSAGAGLGDLYVDSVKAWSKR